jgi:very-short-patch-repair endonuclease
VEEVSAEGLSRASLVDAAARHWRAQLIDLGGRNTLLYYRDLKAGTLDLGTAGEIALAALLAGRAVTLAQLFPDRDAHAQAIKRARTIRNKARELHEERGIETCYVAVGMATWTNTKAAGTSIPAAPVLLRTAQLRARGAAEDDFELRVDDEIELNPTLLHLLDEDFGITLDDKELEELAVADPSLVYERLVKEAVGRVRGFMITPKIVLGTFSYAKLPMVTDLMHAPLDGHDVIAAIAGDRAAQQSLRPPLGELPDPDSIAPRDEYLVLDADSSQNFAINAVLAGQHSVVKGPPGTGKSQTIANLISSLAAQGKRVLFVAEKRAAITAVTDRLTRRGLGHLVMDVHDGTASRRKIAAELKAAFDSAASIALPDLTVLHESLAASRTALDGHQHALHDKRGPWGVSVFEAQTVLIGLTPHLRPMPSVRLRGEVLTALDGGTARRVRSELREYATLGGFTLTGRESGWIGAQIRTPEDAQRAYELADRLAERTLPAARPALLYVVEQTGLRPAVEVEDWRQVFALLDGVRATFAAYEPKVYQTDLEVLVAALADRAWRKEHKGWPGAGAGWLARRRTRKEAASLASGGAKPSRRALFDGLSAALAQRQQWMRAATDRGQPRLPAELDRARAAFDLLDRELAALQAFTPHIPMSTMDLDRLARILVGLAGDERTLRKVPRLNRLTEEFNRLGLDPLVADLEGRRPDADLTGMVFDACWHASILHHLSFVDPRIGMFDAAGHTRIATEYRSLDHQHLDATSRRVLRAVAEHIVRVRDDYPDESRLVEHQANLKRRHLPVRQLFATAPHMLTALKPCWAMSPLVVSQLLPADGQYFDVVVFDEASQVTPADAVPALLRARQVVVAGDEHQLPPTTFFMAADDGSTDDPHGVNADGSIDLSLTTGYESILDVLSSLFPAYLLRWHYRSQDERLIAFSNAHIYDHSLVTFPGTAAASVVAHVPVTAVAQNDSVESVGAEVDRVVELILEHALLRPTESLGVITMGIVHAERIDLALRAALTARPELHGFFGEKAAEPFFVKNLERVQGDERDAIILSIGYGKTADGRLLYRFGPLLLPGGERRLNVAVTRARRRMTVVSSFTAADLDPARTTAEGVRLLRAFLLYAESGGNRLDGAGTERPALNGFEIDVRDRLVAAGIPVTPQYGVAGYFIDFAAVHPTLPDEMVLAIETDGATYHSSHSVRDRDRLRQEQLERLGWRFHRIWSTDWIADPDQEIARVKAAYDDAVAAVDAKRTAEPTVVLPVTPVQPSPVIAQRPGDRPDVVPGKPIAEYSQDELVALVRWIESDTLLRTEDEVVEAARKELGFRRGGSRINAALAAAVANARQANGV